MEDFLKQMVAIDQSRVDREDKRVEKEAIARKQDKAQMAEQRETDKRMMAEQHDRFMQLLQEVQIPHEREKSTTPTSTTFAYPKILRGNRRHGSLPKHL